MESPNTTKNNNVLTQYTDDRNLQKVPEPRAFEAKQFISQVKAFFHFSLQKKNFLAISFIKIQLIALTLWIFKTCLEHKINLDDFSLEAIKEMINSEDLFSVILKAKGAEFMKNIFKIFFIAFFRAMVFLPALFSLFLSSGVFDNKDQLINEVKSHKCSKYTLFISAFSYELLFALITGSLTFFFLLIVYSFDSTYTFSDYLIILAIFSTCSAIKMFTGAVRLYFIGSGFENLLSLLIKISIFFVPIASLEISLLKHFNQTLKSLASFFFSLLMIPFNPIYWFFSFNISFHFKRSADLNQSNALALNEFKEILNSHIQNLNDSIILNYFSFSKFPLSSTLKHFFFTIVSFISIISISFMIFSKIFETETKVSSEKKRKKAFTIVTAIIAILGLVFIILLIRVFYLRCLKTFN